MLKKEKASRGGSLFKRREARCLFHMVEMNGKFTL